MATLNTVNPLGSFIAGKQAGLDLQEQQLGLQQARRNAPIRNQLSDLSLAKAQRQDVTGRREQGVSQERDKLKFMHNAGRALISLPFEQRQQAFERLAPLASQVGIDIAQFSGEELSDQNLSELIASSQDFSRDPSQLSAKQREFESLSKGLSPEDVERARRLALDLDARPSGAAPQIVDVGGVPHVFNKQTGKLKPLDVEGTRVTSDTISKTESQIAEGKEFGKKTGASRANAIDKGVDKILGIDKNIRNINRAITQIDAGASTGVIESKFFPSFRTATKTLEQIQGELALDVIGAVTFGALSKGELDLAREIALPTGLEPKELKDFLIRKRDAQQKLSAYYNEQIQFLDKGGTVAGFVREKEQQQQGQAADQGGDILQQARDAISRGAPREAVLQRLQERGIDAGGL